jgi:hypothetical protein
MSCSSLAAAVQCSASLVRKWQCSRKPCKHYLAISNTWYEHLLSLLEVYSDSSIDHLSSRGMFPAFGVSDMFHLQRRGPDHLIALLSCLLSSSSMVFILLRFVKKLKDRNVCCCKTHIKVQHLPSWCQQAAEQGSRSRSRLHLPVRPLPTPARS